MTRIANAVSVAARQLADLPDAAPRLEAELLLSHLLGKPRIHLVTWPEQELDPAQSAAFDQLVNQRLDGEPIAYLLGEREFWSLNLKVTPDVLIPRPETELLVEQALIALPADLPARVADLGTGSGAIAAALATERPNWRILATDASAAALGVAKRNFGELNLNVETRLGEWCDALPDIAPFHLIVSNPPYIPDSDPHLKLGDVQREPLSALASGTDGLDDIRRIIDCTPAHFVKNGLLLMEHGYNQGEAVCSLLKEKGFSQVRTHRDLAGHERISGGCWANPT